MERGRCAKHVSSLSLFVLCHFAEIFPSLVNCYIQLGKKIFSPCITQLILILVNFTFITAFEGKLTTPWQFFFVMNIFSDVFQFVELPGESNRLREIFPVSADAISAN